MIQSKLRLVEETVCWVNEEEALFKFPQSSYQDVGDINVRKIGGWNVGRASSPERGVVFADHTKGRGKDEAEHRALRETLRDGPEVAEGGEEVDGWIVSGAQRGKD